MHQGGSGGGKRKYDEGRGGPEARAFTLRHDNPVVYHLPVSRDGTQCAMESHVQTDSEFVHFMRESVDTMTAGG